MSDKMSFSETRGVADSNHPLNRLVQQLQRTTLLGMQSIRQIEELKNEKQRLETQIDELEAQISNIQSMDWESTNRDLKNELDMLKQDLELKTQKLFEFNEQFDSFLNPQNMEIN